MNFVVFKVWPKRLKLSLLSHSSLFTDVFVLPHFGPLASKKLMFEALEKWVHLSTGLLYIVRVFHFPRSISSLNLHWRNLL